MTWRRFPENETRRAFGPLWKEREGERKMWSFAPFMMPKQTFFPTEGDPRETRLLWMGVALGLLAGIFFPQQLWATQVHAEPEGLYSHQLGHGFFISSCPWAC